MTIENLEKDLKDGKLGSLYLLYGEDTFLIDSCVKKIKKLFGERISGINYVAIEDSKQDDIIKEIQTPAFGYEKKMIFVKNSGLFKKESKKKSNMNLILQEKIANYIKENKEDIKNYVVLVFVESEVEKNILYQTLDNNGIICEIKELKIPQIAQRLKAIANAYHVKIEDVAVQYLIECCGTNMQYLVNEIRKLIEYVGENGIIKKEYIDSLCIKKIDSVIFDLTDCLGKRELQKALIVLNNLIYQKEPIPKILITLYNHFRKLYLVTLASRENRNLVECLNLKPNQMFLTTKYKMQANYFKTSELRKILEEFIELDANYKAGLIDIQVGLESILSCI